MARTKGAKGRNFTEQKGNKTEFIKIRVSTDQRAVIEALAQTRGESITVATMKGFVELAKSSWNVSTAQFTEFARVLATDR